MLGLGCVNKPIKAIEVFKRAAWILLQQIYLIDHSACWLNIHPNHKFSAVYTINLDKSTSTINTEELLKEQVQLNRLKQQFQRYSLEIAFCLLLIAANVFFYGYQQQLKQQQISALLGQPLPLVVLGNEIWLNPLTAEEPNPGQGSSIGSQFTVATTPTGNISGYETIFVGNVKYHVPKTLLPQTSFINFFIVNLLLIAPFFIAYR